MQLLLASVRVISILDFRGKDGRVSMVPVVMTVADMMPLQAVWISDMFPLNVGVEKETKNKFAI